MKRLFLALALAFAVHAQPIFFTSNYNSTAAATPTFSPVGSSVASGTVVTISTSTSGCNGFIYWNTTGSPTTSDTHSTSATITTAVTVYAKAINCPSALDSAVGSASYTIATVFTDSFSGSGDLNSANWTRIPSMSNGVTKIQQVSGLAQNSAGFNSSAAVVDQITWPRAQYAQADVVTLNGASNSASVCALMNSSGNGYCSNGTNVLKYTSGTGAFLFSTGCTTKAGAGDTLRITTTAGGSITVQKNGVTTCSGSDTTYTSGSPALLLNTSGTSPATDVQVDNFVGSSN